MWFQNKYELFFFKVINVFLWDEPHAIPFLNNKESYWDQKRCGKERIYSYIYSYIPLDSSQYNVLCIISSIHVKSIQNLLASSSEIWHIQLSFKIISFLYYIISTVLLQHTHWNPECTTGFIFIYDCSKKEIKQNR